MFKRTVIFITAVLFILPLVPVSAQKEKGGKHHNKQIGEKAKTENQKAKGKIMGATGNLDLTPEQKARIDEIMAESQKKIKAILEEAQLEIKQIKASSREEIMGVLNEEQKQKFKINRGNSKGLQKGGKTERLEEIGNLDEMSNLDDEGIQESAPEEEGNSESESEPIKDWE